MPLTQTARNQADREQLMVGEPDAVRPDDADVFSVSLSEDDEATVKVAP